MKRLLTMSAVVALAAGCGDAKKKTEADKSQVAPGTAGAKKTGAPDKATPKTAVAPGAQKMPSKALIAFTLGDKLSLAASGYGAGTDRAVALRVWNKANVLGKALGTTVPPLPMVSGTDKAKRGAAMLNYLFDTAGKPIARHLSSKVGAKEAGLFELAVKTNIMRMMYFPDAKKPKTNQSAVKGLEKAAAKGGIPVSMIKPVTDAMLANKQRPEVFKAISVMMRAIRIHLGAPA